MDIEKVRELGEQDLVGEQAKAAEELFRIRFAKSLGKQEGVGKIRGLRKDIARMKTIARERHLAQQKAGS